MSTEQKSKEPQVIPSAIDTKNLPEWITPLLSALGSMGGSYMLWIKPLRERMDDLTNHLTDLKAELKELKQENKEYKKILETLNSPLENKADSENYLPIKKSNHQGSYLTKRI